MKKEIPVKNYLILVLVFLLTVVGVFYAREWYNTSKIYYAQNSVLKDVVREIKSEELSNYVLENQKFILYVASGQDDRIKDFENDFKNLIQDMDLNENILYMNLDEVNTDEFYNLLKTDYAETDKIKSQISSDSLISMYVFSDGKIVTVLNDVNEYSIDRLENIMTRWEMK